jgi:predicted ABC-type ATPase
VHRLRSADVDEDNIELIADAKDAGYIVRVFLIATSDPRINVGTVVADGPRLGDGRVFIPPTAPAG